MLIEGVSSEEEKIIISILKPYIGKYNFFYYGSRVKGDFRAASDLDILVTSDKAIDLNDIEEIKLAFDESFLPYIVNLAYNVSSDFYKLIEKDLIEVF